MLFASRSRPDAWQKLRTAIWPRRSFGRSLRYYGKRVLRLAASPHAVAIGVACGVFASFTPFLGLHVLLAGAIAWLLSGNIIASVISTTSFGNPLTFPLIWGASFETGRLMLHGSAHPVAGVSPAALLHHFSILELLDPLIKPMAIGSIPLGLVFATAAYVATRWGVGEFQRRRAARLRGRPEHSAGEGAGA